MRLDTKHVGVPGSAARARGDIGIRHVRVRFTWALVVQDRRVGDICYLDAHLTQCLQTGFCIGLVKQLGERQ